MEREVNGCDVLRYGVHTDAKNIHYSSGSWVYSTTFKET